MPIFSAAVVPLNDAPVVFLSSEKGVKFWHIHSPELPVAAQTIELKRLDAAFLEKKPSFAAIKASRRIAIKKIAALFAKLTTVSVLCKNVDDASKSFVIQITLGATAATSTSAKNPPTWTDIRIYSLRETIQPYLFAVIKACGIPQTSFLKKAFIGTAGFAAVGFAFAIKAMEPAKPRRGAGLPPAFPNSSRANNDGGHDEPQDPPYGLPNPSLAPADSPRLRPSVVPEPGLALVDADKLDELVEDIVEDIKGKGGLVRLEDIAAAIQQQLGRAKVSVRFLPTDASNLDSLDFLFTRLVQKSDYVGVYVIALSSLNRLFGNRVLCDVLHDYQLRQGFERCKFVVCEDMVMNHLNFREDPGVQFVWKYLEPLVRGSTNSKGFNNKEKSSIFVWNSFRRADISVLEISRDIRNIVDFIVPSHSKGVRVDSVECPLSCFEDIEDCWITECCGYQGCRKCLELALNGSLWRQCPNQNCKMLNAKIKPFAG